MDVRPFGNEAGINLLVCSRGGGLLEEGMELVSELWEENIKAQFVTVSDQGLTEQYEYANEHDTKGLAIITDAGVLRSYNSFSDDPVKAQKDKKLTGM